MLCTRPRDTFESSSLKQSSRADHCQLHSVSKGSKGPTSSRSKEPYAVNTSEFGEDDSTENRILLFQEIRETYDVVWPCHPEYCGYAGDVLESNLAQWDVLTDRNG